jgi:RNA polymerase sigma factor (sigma-70 family)
MDEKAITALLFARKEQALTELKAKYEGLCRRIAGNVQASSEDVEECVADTFIYLWQHPEKFDSCRGTLKTLLCIVARSRAIDRYRELSRRSALPLEEAVLARSAGMQEVLLDQETRRELMTAVTALKEPDREILIRRYFRDQKPRQIALALGMTVKQVDNCLFRTKRLLRQTLEEKGVGL